MARDPSSDAPTERAEALLRDLPEIELLGLLRRSSNYTFLARLTGSEEILAVYKPAQGESPLWDFPDGTLYRREVAAYRLSQTLGWPRIPPTIVRENAPHGVGAMQLFIEADPRRHYLNPGAPLEAAWRQIALFDVIANNADRKAGHVLIDADSEVWVIDHGLTFNVEPKLRTVIWDFAGEPVPAELAGDLERACAGLEGELGAELRELLSPREVRVLRRRLEAVTAPGWRFPHPGSSWSVPWPPV